MAGFTDGSKGVVGPRYATVQDASIYANLAVRTIRYALARGELQAYKVGRRVLISYEDLDKFIKSKPR